MDMEKAFSHWPKLGRISLVGGMGILGIMMFSKRSKSAESFGAETWGVQVYETKMTLTQLKNIIKDASIKTKGNIKTLDNNYGYYFKIDSNDHTKFEGAFKKSGIGGLYEYEAESFEAEGSGGDGESPAGRDDEFGGFHENDCHICQRPYEFSKIARGLAQHYLKESDDGSKDWRSKKNPKGTARTARNLAGAELYWYGLEALEHYMAYGTDSKIKTLVVELLRRSIVPNVMVGDVVQFIESLDIEGVDDLEPRFSKDFTEEMQAEDFFLENERDGAAESFSADEDYLQLREEHGDHDDAHDMVDDMIQDLDKLTAFCISFLHDGAYGGETQGMEDVGGGLQEERVLYIEGSIELKFIYDSKGDNIAIRARYANDPDSPVIYLPRAAFVSTTPQEIEEHH